MLPLRNLSFLLLISYKKISLGKIQGVKARLEDG